ncbi:hypothetical protein GLOIN_2v1519028 [Rhizophagus irregularis DAOM 181602=DAOM 197198]|uniref:F-box domain-containing protein n=2 Tax=Rhizophagus irregularis TaxID=588596 RepID=A0A015LCP9_RHIIW|nr:hypothetical protein RirG_023340 [Rhizophagus irregularis DAOM 197198w]GBC25951.1 hypothetical protein GLOIN_2v1519028 [Rhizophagus irregularis DAOM 181602=DAOM 197198]CAG8584528.1 11938_t:CDS:2 [Rhizophagus irregularis]
MDKINSNILNKSPVLVPDCLNLVFNYLANDKNTLFSCLFVNHLWCNLAAQHLWKDPFSLTSKIQKVKLFQVYVSSLPHKEIRQLNEKGLKIPNLVTPNFKLPYFSYLKQIFYRKIEECALEWLLYEDDSDSSDKFSLNCFENMEYNDDDISDEEYEPTESELEVSSEESSDECSEDDSGSMKIVFRDTFFQQDPNHPVFALHQKALTFAVFKQLLASCNKLDVLNMSLFSSNSTIPDIVLIPGCHTAFSDITVFNFFQKGIYGDAERAKIICFLNILGYSSRNISKIGIIVDTEIEETYISNLINVQEDLKYLTIKYAQGRTNLQSFLESIPQTLVYLELYAVKLSDCSFNALFECKNLEEIKLVRCRFICHKLDQEQVSESEGLKLRKIFWKENVYNHYKYFVSLIRGANKTLKEVVLCLPANRVRDVTDTNEILNALAKFCPNIKLFAILDVYSYYTQLVKVFESYPWENLTSLTLGSEHSYSVPYIAIDRLAPYLPASLRKLRIACAVSEQDLKTFFDKCQAPIEELSIPNLNQIFTNRHLRIIRDYIKEKRTLKQFDFEFSHNQVISYELWKEIKEMVDTRTHHLFDPFYYPPCDLF